MIDAPLTPRMLTPVLIYIGFKVAYRHRSKPHKCGKTTLMDLNKMKTAELRQLKDDIDVAIKDRQRQDRVDAKAAAEAAAAAYGFSLSELIDSQKPTKSKAPAKYRNPDDLGQTWSGRGRKPQWLVAALEAGADITDLEI